MKKKITGDLCTGAYKEGATKMRWLTRNNNFYKLAFPILFLMGIFCVGLIDPNENDGEAIKLPPAIIFEADHIFVEKSPQNINEIKAMFEKNGKVDSTTVYAIEKLNRQSVFNKDDSEVGYRIYFEFFAEVQGKYEFDLVYDADTASTVLIDQQPIFFSNLAVEGNAAKPIKEAVILEDGWHTFEFMALQNCCGSSITFSVRRPGQSKINIINSDSLQLPYSSR